MIETLRPIDGPGVCGADFPLRVSGLGSSQILGFSDDLRPPGLIPQGAALAPPGARPQWQAGQAPAMQAIGPPRATGAPELREPAQYASPPRAQAVLGPINITPPAVLACPVVAVLDGWLANAVQPAALRWLGQPVVEIKQISAYSCRPMNGQRGAPISEHAFGNALDVAAFVFSDGRKLTVKDGWHGLAAERAFLHEVQATACEQFSTVLAPGSNAFHYDHIHVDLARHAGGQSICNPKPVPGDVIARGYEPATGSLGSARFSPARMNFSGVRRGEDDGYASPGAD